MDNSPFKIDGASDDRWRRFAKPTKKRQFGLRWLFVVITAIGVLLAPYVWMEMRVRKQEFALQELGEYGKKSTLVDGWVHRIDLGYYPRTYGDPDDAPNIDHLMLHLQALPALVECDLTQAKLSKKGLRQLARLKNLKKLKLFNTDIGDEKLACLAGLTNLETLNLSSTQITDAGLTHLQGMTELRELDLSAVSPTVELTHPRITDSGLEKLKHLRGLRTLKLRQSFATDAGVEHLTTLRALVELDISGTNITPTGVMLLEQALPKCKTTYDNPRRLAPFPLSMERDDSVPAETHVDER